MSDELPETNNAGGRLEITEEELALTPSPSAAVRPSTPPPPVRSMPAMVTPIEATDDDGEVAGRPSEATRLMCAAAYLDSRFAEDVVDEIIYEHHRAVHIPPGVDIAAVAKHCVAACRQKVVRDATLTVVLVLAVVLFFMKPSLSWFLLGYVVAWAIVLLDVWAATYYIVVKRLSPAAFASYPPPEPSDPYVARRIAELAQDQYGNLTTYSGFMPFSGAGKLAGGWSFLVDLSKGKQNPFGGETSALRELTAYELYERIRGSLGALEMRKLAIRDRLFVSGPDVRGDQTLLPNPLGRPVSWVDQGVLNHYITTPSHRVRHYLCTEVVDWRGELVVSLFMRFWVSNDRLFCELSKFVLFPLKEDLHRLDGLAGKIELRYVLSTAARQFFATFGLWVRSPKIIFRPFSRGRERARAATRAERDPFFDYGAPVTAIDRVRSTDHRRYFQRLDNERYDKVLERTVLDTIYKVLDEHGVDTSEFTANSSTIIANSTIMNMNNSSISGNVAIGPRARAAQFVAGAPKTPAPAPASPSP
jgi:hypothetical protein